MKKIICILLTIVTVGAVKAQPTIQWQKNFGGSLGDYAHAVHQTMDGGYIVAGFSASSNFDVSGNKGNDDFWLVKLNSSGVIQWQKCLGGTSFDNAYAIQQTSDSGYVVTGSAASNNGDVTGNKGNDDYWVVKLSSSGVIQWQKCFGGTSFDDAFSIEQTADGGYILAGDTQSNDGDVSGNKGSYDAWIVKLDNAGNIQWAKCLGGSGDDSAASVKQTVDRGYIIAGSTTSNDGDVSGNKGNFDYWVVKLDSTGSIQWQKCLGGTGEDVGYRIRQTTDSGYVVAGFTKSADGDVTGLHGTGAQPDYWIVKLTSTGVIQWQKCLGGFNDDKAYSVYQTSDGGYVTTGFTKSNDGDVTFNHGSVGTQDYWIVKLNSSGTIQWEKSYGGSTDDWARAIEQTADGGFIVAGWSKSNNGDLTGNNGNFDYWVVKLNPLSGIQEYNVSPWQIYPNPSTGSFSVNGITDNATLKILNPVGQIIFETEVSKIKTQVNLSGCSQGIYFAVITDEKQKRVQKIVIE